jgi:hypothetical protein
MHNVYSAGSATLSMAQAGARFTNSLIAALEGAKGIVEPTFVYSPAAAKDGIEVRFMTISFSTSCVKFEFLVLVVCY